MTIRRQLFTISGLCLPYKCCTQVIFLPPSPYFGFSTSSQYYVVGGVQVRYALFNWLDSSSALWLSLYYSTILFFLRPFSSFWVTLRSLPPFLCSHPPNIHDHFSGIIIGYMGFSHTPLIMVCSPLMTLFMTPLVDNFNFSWYYPTHPSSGWIPPQNPS